METRPHFDISSQINGRMYSPRSSGDLVMEGSGGSSCKKSLDLFIMQQVKW